MTGLALHCLSASDVEVLREMLADYRQRKVEKRQLEEGRKANRHLAAAAKKPKRKK